MCQFSYFSADAVLAVQTAQQLLTTNKYINIMNKQTYSTHLHSPIATLKHSQNRLNHLDQSITHSETYQDYAQQKLVSKPYTLANNKCANCQNLTKYIKSLTSQLLTVQAVIIEKQQQLSQIIKKQSQTINQLRNQLQFDQKHNKNCRVNTEASQTNFTSVFCVQTRGKEFQSLNRDSVQRSYPPFSSVDQKMIQGHSFCKAITGSIISHKNRQRRPLQSQNIPPNSQNNTKCSKLQKLKFQNQTLKNYNSTLLAQIDKLKRNKGNSRQPHVYER